MLCTIIGALVAAIISATIYALIGGIALKIAYKAVFREYSMEYGDAFKLMFIAGLFAFGANVMMSFFQVDSIVLNIGLPVFVNFCVVTFVLVQWEGLNFGQAVAVGAFTSVFFLLLIFAISMAFVGAIVGAGAAVSP